MSNCLRTNLAQPAFDMNRDLAEDGSNFSDERAELTDGALLRTILKRGADRGEIDPARLTPRIIGLPTDLAPYEMLMTLRPLSDEIIREIVEEVFLVGRDREKKEGKTSFSAQ
jgi:hypothetical protein